MLIGLLRADIRMPYCQGSLIFRYPDRFRSVLVIEDNAMIALDLSDALHEAGYTVVGGADTSDAAHALLRTQTPAFAILDIMLHDGPCQSVARALRERGVPFVVHTACARRGPLADAFRGGSWLAKPAVSRDVVVALRALATRETTS